MYDRSWPELSWKGLQKLVDAGAGKNSSLKTKDPSQSEKHTLLQAKMVEIYIRFQTNTTPFEASHNYVPI